MQGHEVTYSGAQQIMELGERRDIQQAAVEDSAVRQSVMRHSMKCMLHLRQLSALTHTIIAAVGRIEDAEELAGEWQQLVDDEYGRRMYTVAYTHSKLPEKRQV